MSQGANRPRRGANQPGDEMAKGRKSQTVNLQCLVLIVVWYRVR